VGDLLLKYWPLVLVLGGLCAAWGKIRYQAGSGERASASLKKYLFKEDGSLIYFRADQAEVLETSLKGEIKELSDKALTKEDHEHLCAAHLADFSDKVVSKIQEKIHVDEKAIARAVVLAIKEAE